MAFLRLTGRWNILQDNGFIVEVIIVTQDDASSMWGHASHSNGTVRSNNLQGYVIDEYLDMRILWNDGTEGHYRGKLIRGRFDPPGVGHLEGETYDERNPESRADWHTNETFNIR